MTIPFYTTQWFRAAVKNLFMFLLSHLGVLAAVYFITTGFWPRIIALAFTAAIIIYSFVKRFSAKDEEMGISTVVILSLLMTIAYAGARNFGYLPVMRILPIGAAAAAICFLVLQHMKNLDRIIDLLSLTTVQPVRDITRLNNICISIFALFALLAAAAAGNVKLDGVFSSLGGALLAGLRFLFSLIPKSKVTEQPITPQNEPPPPALDGMLEQKGEPWAIWAILEKIVIYVTIFLIIALVICGIIYACYRIYKRFYEVQSVSGDIKKFITPDLLSSKAITTRLRNMFPKSRPQNKIRRAYYKIIRRHISQGVPLVKTDTPLEMKDKILAAGHDISALTVDYEKERYGNL
jgi:hypothetical protein